MRNIVLSLLVSLGSLGLCLGFATSARAGDLYLVEDLQTATPLDTAETENLRLLDIDTANDWGDAGSGQMSAQSGRRIWYGGEMLWWTGGSLLLSLIGGTVTYTCETEPCLLGISLWGLGSLGVTFSGMYVHAKYGYWGRAFASLGLRAGVPIVSGFLGVVLSGSDGLASLGVGFVGLLVGAIAGHTFDYMMAYREESGVTNEPPTTNEAEFDVRISPYFNVTEEEQSAGLLVAF